MSLRKNRKVILSVILLLFIASVVGYEFRKEVFNKVVFYSREKIDLPLYTKNLDDFTLNNGGEYKLINSAIKQDYGIFFSGKIDGFDTLLIGKGTGKYLSSYITLNRDSIILTKVTNIEVREAYKHNLRLQDSLKIDIKRKVNLASITILDQVDTFKLDTDFVGMGHPFVRSFGSTINVNRFEFTCDDYYSDLYVFGDSYVNCGNPKRWPYYIYNQGYQLLFDGLPGGNSDASFDFLNSAFSIHKPKYVFWCLGMNDGSDRLGTDLSWKFHLEKVMDLCKQNDITLILGTIPSIPTKDHNGKNTIIRESGYRYVDFDKAVSDGNGNWKDGMLSDDGVHPTAVGAKAMSEQFLADFPEIKNYIRQEAP